MKQKMAVGIVLAICAIAITGYNIYRYPAMFKDLSDNSSGDAEVEELRTELAVLDDKKVL